MKNSVAESLEVAQNDNDSNACNLTIEDLCQMSGYDYSFVTKFISGVYDTDETRFSDLCKANSKSVGSAHKKFYNTKVLEAIKAYQLSAHGNMKNSDVANASTMEIVQKASQMMDLQVIAESGNVEAMQQFMQRMIVYTQSIHDEKEARQRAELAEKKLIDQQPKVEFFDDVTGSSDTIDMKEVAKVLNVKGVGRNKLFEILRNEKILDRNNQPYQKFVDKGFFRIVESRYTVPDGSVKIHLKTVVFQKGVKMIRDLLKKQAA